MNTSHRPSLETIINSFYSVTSSGAYTLDGEVIDDAALPNWARKAFADHAETGESAYCVICQDNARRMFEEKVKQAQADHADLIRTQDDARF